MLTMTRLLPKLCHDRFVLRMPIRKSAGKRSSLSGARFRQRVAYLREVLAASFTTVVLVRSLSLDDPKCYAGIQLVNQSENSPSSLLCFLRGIRLFSRESHEESIPVSLCAPVLYSFIVPDVRCEGEESSSMLY